MKQEADMVGWSPADPVSYTDAAGATHWYPEAAATLFFSDCSEETATSAAARLRRQFWRITEEITPRQSWARCAISIHHRSTGFGSLTLSDHAASRPRLWTDRGGARQRALSVSVSAQGTGSDSCRPRPR